MEIFFKRLWDAVGGFFFLFSHMQDKLSKHSSQVDLLKELLNLQKDMITMMLSMLEGLFYLTPILLWYLGTSFSPLVSRLIAFVLHFRKRCKRDDRKTDGGHTGGICCQRRADSQIFRYVFEIESSHRGPFVQRNRSERRWLGHAERFQR